MPSVKATRGVPRPGSTLLLMCISRGRLPWHLRSLPSLPRLEQIAGLLASAGESHVGRLASLRREVPQLASDSGGEHRLDMMGRTNDLASESGG